MRLIFVICTILSVAACSRPLATGERAFARDIFGDGLNPDSVRIVAGIGVGKVPEARPLPKKSSDITPRPGICDRVAPQGPSGPPPGWALYNQVHLARRYYREDVVPGWPYQILLPQALIMAHELVHVWQWQNRGRTGYRPVKAALENLLNLDPYFYMPDESAGFLEYGFEQQAALVEDYMCYGMFDPQNPRRASLRAMLAPYFRVDRIDEVLAR